MKIYKISQINKNLSTLEEYLDYETDITKDILKKLIATCKLTGKDFGRIVKLTENGKNFWFEFDEVNNSYSLIDINNWIHSLDETDALEFMGIEEDNLYIGDMGFLGDIRKNPGEVYHYTTEEKWKKIQKDGVLKPSRGTGLGNSSAYGIFASINPEEYANGTYGNVLLKIDLQRFKQEQDFKN